MSDAQNNGEQSMDDILASIRKIISNDAVPSEAAAKTQSEGTAEAEPRDGAPLPMETQAENPAKHQSGTAGVGGTGGASGNVTAADDLSDILGPVSSSQQINSVQAAANAPVERTQPAARPQASEFAEHQPNTLEQGLQSKLVALDQLQSEAAVERQPSAPGEPVEPMAMRLLDADQPPPQPELEDPGQVVGNDAPQGPNADRSMHIPSFEAPVVAKGEDLGDSVTGNGSATSRETVSAPEPIESVSEITVERDVPIPVQQEAAAPNEVAKRHPEEAQNAPVDGVAADAVAAAAIAPSMANPATDIEPTANPLIVSELDQTPRDFGGERTLEAVVVDALQPLLKAWLDENLPRIVEEKVAAELANRTPKATN